MCMEENKLDKLSLGLQKLIVENSSLVKGTLSENIKESSMPVSRFAERTLLHCNGGSTLEAALWLKNHLKNGCSKLFSSGRDAG